jgi:hypothetical protein
MQNYKTTNDWTQQERMKMESGHKGTRNKVIADNSRLYKVSTGKEYVKKKTSVPPKKVSTPPKKKQVVVPPPTKKKSGGEQTVDLGGGGDSLFDREMTEPLENSQSN